MVKHLPVLVGATYSNLRVLSHESRRELGAWYTQHYTLLDPENKEHRVTFSNRHWRAYCHSCAGSSCVHAHYVQRAWDKLKEEP